MVGWSLSAVPASGSRVLFLRVALPYSTHTVVDREWRGLFLFDVPRIFLLELVCFLAVQLGAVAWGLGRAQEDRDQSPSGQAHQARVALLLGARMALNVFRFSSPLSLLAF